MRYNANGFSNENQVHQEMSWSFNKAHRQFKGDLLQIWLQRCDDAYELIEWQKNLVWCYTYL